MKPFFASFIWHETVYTFSILYTVTKIINISSAQQHQVKLPVQLFLEKLKIQLFILLFQWTNWQERGNGEYLKKIFSTIHTQQTELISSQHFYLFVEKWKEYFTFSQSQGV